MGRSRQFQNLILDSPFSGAKWLRRVDLTGQLFGKTSTTAVKDSTSQIPASFLDVARVTFPGPLYRFRNIAKHLKMERILLPKPIFRFHDAVASGDVCCFPLSSSKEMVLADQAGRAFLWHADTCNVVPLPSLVKPKSSPISLFVPGADGDGQSSSYGSLYIMEKRLKPDDEDDEEGPSTQPSDQIEALVHVSEGMWHSRCLPLPPFIHRPSYSYAEITSYAVVGTRICISIDHKASYWLDTTNNTWEVGNGVLSTFRGKLEYAPELKLWFGFSGKDMQLAAMDLSASARDIPAQLQLVGDCNEFDAPEGWLECCCSQLVNLGSGRFCMIRFFQNLPLPGDGEMSVTVVVLLTPNFGRAKRMTGGPEHSRIVKRNRQTSMWIATLNGSASDHAVG